MTTMTVVRWRRRQRHARAAPKTARAASTPTQSTTAVGGLTRYAAGNDSLIIRTVNGVQTTYAVHLRDLIRDGDITSNVALQPGDILIIPQRLF